MRRAFLGLGFTFVCGLAAVVACVGDETTPQDASTNDAAVVDQTTVDQNTTDSPADTTVNETSVDAGPDVCSNPPVGSSFQLPTNTFNASTAFNSSPIIAGDYTATSTSVYNGCNFGTCPTVRFGNMLGGVTVTSTGSSTATIQRHIEVLQGSTHVTFQDRFDVSFDQLSRTFTVTPRCSQDGGVVGSDGGTWTGGFPLATDGGPSGTFELWFTDVPVQLIMPDGGSGGTGQPYVNFTKQ